MYRLPIIIVSEMRFIVENQLDKISLNDPQELIGLYYKMELKAIVERLAYALFYSEEV